MAHRKDVTLIKQVLSEGLKHLKKPSKIRVRKSGVEDNLHVYLLSDSFSRWSLTKRQKLVEDILQRELSPEVVLRISALFILTQKEAEDV
jgi:stress-induced morphogen